MESELKIIRLISCTTSQLLLIRFGMLSLSDYKLGIGSKISVITSILTSSMFLFIQNEPNEEADILYSRPRGYPTSNGDQWWSERQRFPAYSQPSMYEPCYRTRFNKNRSRNTQDMPQRRFKVCGFASL